MSFFFCVQNAMGNVYFFILYKYKLYFSLSKFNITLGDFPQHSNSVHIKLLNYSYHCI